MKKNNIKALICIAALVSSMSTTTAIADDLSILQGENITHGASDPASYDNVNNAGTFTNEATLNVTNQLSNSSILSNSSSITANSIINETTGEITNNGSLSSTTLNNSGNIINAAGANIEIANGTNILTNDGTISNNGTLTTETLTNSSNITGRGTLNFSQGTNSGSINQSTINTGTSSYINDGTITAEILNNEANLTNSGTISFNGGKNTGSISGGIIQITGNYTNDGELNISDDNFTFDKTLDGNGTLLVKGTNTGNIDQKVLVTNGNLVNNGNIVLTADSTAPAPNSSSIINDGNGTLLNNDEISGTGSLTVDNGKNVDNAVIRQGSLTINGTKAFSDVHTADGEDIHFINGGDIIVDNLTNKGTISTTDSYSDGTITVKNGSNTGSIIQKKFTVDKSTNTSDKFTNDGTIAAEVENKGVFVNNGTIGKQGSTNNSITNSGNFTNATGANIYATDITNSGTFENNADISSSGEITNAINSIFTNGEDGDMRVNSVSNAGILNNHGEMYVTNSFTNSGSLNNDNFLSVKNDDTPLSATFENTGTIENSGTLTADNFTNSNSVTNSAIFNVYNNFTNKSNFTNQNRGQLGVYGDLLNESTAQLINKNNASIDMESSDKTLTNNGIIKNSQNASINMNSNKLINNGTIENDNGHINDAILENNNKITADNQSWLNLESLKNDNGTIDLNGGSTLDIANQTSQIAGIINSLGHAQETLPDGSIGIIANKISTNAGAEFVGNLNIGDGAKDSYLAISGLNVKENATVNIAQRASLSVGENATLNLDTGDTVSGDITLEQGIAGQEGTINLDNFTLETGLNSTLKGGNQAYYSQNGGTLNLLNNSTLKLGDSNAMRGGDLNIDGTSQFLVTSEENGTIDSGNFLNNLTIADGGRFGVMNGEGAEYNIGNINVNNGTANFTIDVLGRSNAQNEHGTDQFIGTDINGNGTINIEDWTLAGDIFGWQAPIDRDIKLDNVFDYQNISPNVQLSATKKEVFTPIGWYQLNNHGGMTGNYQLNLTRFNPQVYRGQVTTLAQYMNQLAIDDMLFNHSMLLPSFKDDEVSDNGAMINRLASANPVYAPYQYSKKDGGLWYRMYGTFETLQMNQAGLGRVGNNAYGTIIGADFGLKDLRNGWKFMPTAYIGYNGAHQYFAGMGAYQNGGQAGFLGTWYKNNFVLGGLIYGGVYQNSMDIAGHTDNTFNYFAGASAKGAYNWHLHRDWVLQPNLMLAYNFFGQQNWHTDYGQMGMMSGTLNGINLAPGLNLIWEKETFSIYATLQYMYNLNGAVDGRAGNVSLPHLYMDRGYIQYGFGFTKRFADRFSGYFQTVFRNVGRTGVGFQLGLNIKLGK